MSTRTLMAVGLLALTACGPRQSGASGQAAAGQRADIPAVTDGNIAAILTASNMMEIRPSELAVEKAQDPRVQEYARDMIKQHTWVQLRLQQILVDGDIERAPDALSLQLNRNLGATMTNLQRAYGDNFDTEYVLQQIAAHQFALHSLETTLIPSTEDGRLKDFLASDVRPAVERHLERVKQLHADMLIGPQA